MLRNLSHSTQFGRKFHIFLVTSGDFWYLLEWWGFRVHLWRSIQFLPNTNLQQDVKPFLIRRKNLGKVFRKLCVHRTLNRTLKNLNTLNSFLTFDQIQNLTTRTPFCKNYGKDDNKECHFCNMTFLDDCQALTTFEDIHECTNREGPAVLYIVNNSNLIFLKSSMYKSPKRIRKPVHLDKVW